MSDMITIICDFKTDTKIERREVARFRRFLNREQAFNWHRQGRGAYTKFASDVAATVAEVKRLLPRRAMVTILTGGERENLMGYVPSKAEQLAGLA